MLLQPRAATYSVLAILCKKSSKIEGELKTSHICCFSFSLPRFLFLSILCVTILLCTLIQPIHIYVPKTPSLLILTEPILSKHVQAGLFYHKICLNAILIKHNISMVTSQYKYALAKILKISLGSA
jgi:hypothetical protein